MMRCRECKAPMVNARTWDDSGQDERKQWKHLGYVRRSRSGKCRDCYARTGLKCRCCDRITIVNERWGMLSQELRLEIRDTHARRGSLGMCSGCYSKSRRRITGKKYPSWGPTREPRRTQVPRSVVLSEWDFFHDPGKSRRANIIDIADKIGMTPAALERALYRANQEDS